MLWRDRYVLQISDALPTDAAGIRDGESTGSLAEGRPADRYDSPVR